MSLSTNIDKYLFSLLYTAWLLCSYITQKGCGVPCVGAESKIGNALSNKMGKSEYQLDNSQTHETHAKKQAWNKRTLHPGVQLLPILIAN